MKDLKKILKNIRLKINKIGANKRNEKLKSKDFSIISNNCFAGIVYQHLGLQYNTPTIGLYFYPKEYIKFLKNFDFYIKQPLTFIKTNKSKYYESLCENGYNNVIIGVLKDVEIVFLHYKTQEEARNKWEKRCKRLSKNIIFKFNDQNDCTYEDLKEFDELKYENKLLFTSGKHEELKSNIFIRKYRNSKNIKEDYYSCYKYIDLIEYINNIKIGKEKSKKILVIGMTKNHGGIESFILNMYKEINKNNFKIDFINMYDDEIVGYDLFNQGKSNIFNVSNEYKRPLKCYKELNKILANNKYDIVHINKNSICSPIILAAVKNAKVPVRIIHSHNTQSTGGSFGDILHFINKRFLHKYCNYYFACSNDAGKWMFNNKILNSNKYFIINNAIDLEKFIFDMQKREKIRNELKIDKNSFVVGHVGRFEGQKNHDFLIDIFYKILDKRADAKLVLVGEGSCMNNIKEKVEQYKISDRVVFLGKRNDTSELYQAFDVFCLPSIYEGLGIVNLESQAAGLPTIMSDKVPKAAKVTELGKFVKLESSSEEWAEFIIKTGSNIYRDKDKQVYIDEIREAGYDIKSETKKIEKLYFDFIRLEENNE